jgi:hypothetical protein
MKWARANGCPWGVWNSTTCTQVCFLGCFGILLDRQATLDAILWAHAAGCPCDGGQHRITGTLERKSNSSGSRGSGSSSNSSRRDDAGYDLYDGVDLHNG